MCLSKCQVINISMNSLYRYEEQNRRRPVENMEKSKGQTGEEQKVSSNLAIQKCKYMIFW
jgi:hypothetical protein